MSYLGYTLIFVLRNRYYLKVSIFEFRFGQCHSYSSFTLVELKFVIVFQDRYYVRIATVFDDDFGGIGVIK